MDVFFGLSILAIACVLFDRYRWMEDSDTATRVILSSEECNLKMLHETLQMLVHEKTEDRFTKTEAKETLRWLMHSGQLSNIPEWAK